MDLNYPLSSASALPTPKKKRVRAPRVRNRNARPPQTGVVTSYDADGELLLRGSVYSLTFNTNTAPKYQGLANIMGARLTQAIYTVLNSRNKILPFIQFRNADGYGDSWPYAHSPRLRPAGYDMSRHYHLIDSIQITSLGIERGPKTGFLHAHMSIAIYHHVGDEGIRLWVEDIRRAVDAELQKDGYQCPFVYAEAKTPDFIKDLYNEKEDAFGRAAESETESDTDSESD